MVMEPEARHTVAGELRFHVEEQAALRRVATLVARGTSRPEILNAVAGELDRLFGADIALLVRYEPGDMCTVLASSGRAAAGAESGMRVRLDRDGVAARIWKTGRPARFERSEDDAALVGEHVLELGIQASVGAPVVVEGRLWGAMTAAWTRADTAAADEAERRLPSFAELVGTAIANADSRAELQLRMAEHAALRRVATLVARATAPGEVYEAVAREMLALFEADATRVLRYDRSGGVTVLAAFGAGSDATPPGFRVPLDGDSVAARVLHSGRAARMESFERTDGEIARLARELGVSSTVGAPIIVDGAVWGLAIANWAEHEPPAGDVEERLEKFTELAATAVANAESRAELTASRARVVAAADASRRRIERDLHDGAQQALVALALEIRSAQAAVPPELDALRAELDRIVERLTEALAELREIAHGIHPALLTEDGLVRALRTLARRSAVPVELDLPDSLALPEPVEVAAYYAVSEALANASKHARASLVRVAVRVQDHVLRVAVSDDGAGGADPSRGSGLLGLRDRVSAIGGQIEIQSPAGAGTTLLVELPVDHSLAADSTAAVAATR
jgi:signal transduction histidine kinase